MSSLEVKTGQKVKQVSDGTIWMVTQKLAEGYWGIERKDGENTLVSLLFVNDGKFTTEI